MYIKNRTASVFMLLYFLRWWIARAFLSKQSLYQWIGDTASIYQFCRMNLFYIISFQKSIHSTNVKVQT